MNTPAPSPLELTQLRLGLLASGYVPLPAQGKAIHLRGWNTIDVDGIRIPTWEFKPAWTNTGLRCRETPALDVDITQPAAAEAVEALVRGRFCDHGRVLVRTGRAPKRCIPFRTSQPFRKIKAELIAPDGSLEKIEFLGNGQQFITDGVHPDTNAPYVWVNGAQPGSVALSELPEINREDAKQLIEDAVELLVIEHGYKRAGTTQAASEHTGTDEFDNAAAPDEVHPVVIEEYQDYFAVIDPDIDYGEWFKLSCALFNTLGPETGKRVAIEWSKRGRKYKAGELDRKWDGINEKNAYGYGRQTILNAWALACEARMTEQERADLQQSVENIIANAKRKKEQQSQAPPANQSTAITTRASDLTPRAKRWLWHSHLLRGALELLTGVPGIGKSQVQISYIACVTAGLRWPDGSPGMAPANVLMVSAEDTLEQEIIPRLIAAGADLRRVHFLNCIRTDKKTNRQFLLGEDLDAMERKINEIGNVALVAIDPITSYMGGKMDSHKATEVRSQLGPLKDFSERTDVAVSAITHPPKSTSQKAIDQFIGSQAFIAACRIGHVVIPEFEEGEDDNGRKTNVETGRILFALAKHNASAATPTYAYEIKVVIIGKDPVSGEDIDAACVAWDPTELGITPNEAVAASAGPPRQTDTSANDLQNFLCRRLKDGPVWAADIEREAANWGCTENQLQRETRYRFRKEYGTSGRVAVEVSFGGVRCVRCGERVCYKEIYEPL